MLWLLSGPAEFTCWVSLALVFSCIYCWNLVFALSPFYILIYIFRRWCMDKLGAFHATKHLCVLIHIWTKCEVVALWNQLKPSSKIFLLTVSRRYFFCGLFCGIYVLCLSCFCVCPLLTCGHLKGDGWLLGSCFCCSLRFCYFPIRYPRTCVAPDSIDSWSLLSFLLCTFRPEFF